MKNLSNDSVIHIKNEKIEYLQFKKLLEYKDIINHAYTIGLDIGFKTKNSNGEIIEERYNLAKQSYKKICEALKSDYKNIVRANQNHTDIVKIVEEASVNQKLDITLIQDKEDGLITNKKDIMLSTTNADCILLMFFDPIKKVIANTHSGWRGTVQRISVKTLRKMIEEYGCNPKDVICCICPSIRKCHFEVDEEVKNIFVQEFSNLEPYYKKKGIKFSDLIEENIKNKKWNIDTVLINKIILQQEGMKESNIIDSGICSMCNADIIHSYRVEKEKYNVETALIELK